MTFGSVFGRTFSPTFQPSSQAAVAAGGWWLAGGIAAANCVAAYQAKGAADYAASKVNLNNPGTHDATNGADYPTWDSTNGWKFSGLAAQHLLTDFKLADGYTIIFRFSNKTGTAGTLGGSYNYSGSTGGMLIFPYNSTSLIRYYSPNLFGSSAGLTEGVAAIAGNNGYRNGTADGSGSGSLPTQNDNMVIGGNFMEAYVKNTITAYIQACAVYTITLISTQVGLLSTAMNAL